jgi:hypothetical protein
MAKKSKPKLTPRRRALIKNLAKGMKPADAEKAAGFAPHNGQSAYQALKEIAKTTEGSQLLARHGLTDDALIEKYLKPLMDAEETKFFQHNGKVKQKINVVAWGPREAGLNLALKIRGLTSGDEEKGKGGSVTIIFDMPMPQPMLPAKSSNGDGDKS